MTLLFIGKSYAEIYGRVNSSLSGPDEAESITSLVMDGVAVWACHGNNISKYIRGRKVDQEIAFDIHPTKVLYRWLECLILLPRH